MFMKHDYSVTIVVEFTANGFSEELKIVEVTNPFGLIDIDISFINRALKSESKNRGNLYLEGMSYRIALNPRIKLVEETYHCLVGYEVSYYEIFKNVFHYDFVEIQGIVTGFDEENRTAFMRDSLGMRCKFEFPEKSEQVFKAAFLEYLDFGEDAKSIKVFLPR